LNLQLHFHGRWPAYLDEVLDGEIGLG